MLKKSQLCNLAKEDICSKIELLILSPYEGTHLTHTGIDARKVCILHPYFLDVNCPEITYIL
jgi:hypothetical protein